MSRELIEFSELIDEQFELVITLESGFWDFILSLGYQKK